MQSQRIVELDDRSRRQLAHTRPETQVALSVVTVSDDYRPLRHRQVGSVAGCSTASAMS